MNHAHTAPVDSAPTQGESAPAPLPSRAAFLLYFIRRMVVVGLEHFAAVRARPEREQAPVLARRFGTFNLTLVLARILRGLRIAAALEDRVIATTARIDAVPMVRLVEPRPNRPRAKSLSEEERDAALLARTPTDEEIAEMVRGRTIGAVLADICADLGIGVGHPLWREAEYLIACYRGPVDEAMKRGFRRHNDARMAAEQGPVPDGVFYTLPERIPDTTGPPPLQAAA